LQNQSKENRPEANNFGLNKEKATTCIPETGHRAAIMFVQQEQDGLIGLGKSKKIRVLFYFAQAWGK